MKNKLNRDSINAIVAKSKDWRIARDAKATKRISKGLSELKEGEPELFKRNIKKQVAESNVVHFRKNMYK